MSLKKNVAASYVSQAYVTLLGIVLLPVYIRYMGAEAYGLVGFFTVLQAWFNLLDLGMGTTVARETARYKGGGITALGYRQFLRALGAIFWLIALVGGALLFALAGPVASHWLKLQNLPLAEVRDAVQLMALAVALRWLAGLYRGIISGAEQLAWLGMYNMLVATLRFAGVLGVFIWVGHSPAIFFGYQLLVAALELAGLAYRSRRLLPLPPAGTGVPRLSAQAFTALRPSLSFSLHMAFLTMVWVLTTQTDKLILSTLLPLDDYGHYSLAVAVAGGVTMASTPLGTAVMLRMTRLQAQHDAAGVLRVYRHATQVTAALVAPVCLALALFADKLLWVLTGDADIAARAAPTLALYALGNGILALAAFPYYLQYANGNLRLHMANNLLFLVLLVPALAYASVKHGAVGAGWVWLAVNALSFMLWAPRVHRKFAGDTLRGWFTRDIVRPTAAALAVLAVAWAALVQTLGWADSRVAVLAQVALPGALALLAAIACTDEYKHTLPALAKNLLHAFRRPR